MVSQFQSRENTLNLRSTLNFCANLHGICTNQVLVQNLGETGSARMICLFKFANFLELILLY